MKSKSEKLKTKGWTRQAAPLLLLLLSAVHCSLPTALHATRVHTSGFETNNTTATEWNAASGTFALDTGTVHSGVYSMRYNLSAQQGNVTRTVATQTSGTHYYRWFRRWATLPASATPSLFENSGSGGTTARVLIVGGGSPVLRLNNNTTGTNADMTTVLTTGVWYRIELAHTLLDAGGSMELRLYSDMDASPLETVSITGEDTLRTNVSSFLVGSAAANSTQDFYDDDIVVNHTAASPFNTWVGPSNIALAVPGANDSTAWTATGAGCTGAGNYDCVNDEPGTPDDATTYNTHATANGEDRLGLATLPAEIPSDAVMIAMTVMDRWDGNGNTGTRQGRHLVWDDGGSQTNGPTHTRCDVAAGNWTMASTAQITTMNLSGKTKANVGSYDLGYEPLNNAECRVTAIWGSVEWAPAPAAPTCTNSIALTGVGCR